MEILSSMGKVLKLAFASLAPAEEDVRLESRAESKPRERWVEAPKPAEVTKNVETKDKSFDKTKWV